MENIRYIGEYEAFSEYSPGAYKSTLSGDCRSGTKLMGQY